MYEVEREGEGARLYFNHTLSLPPGTTRDLVAVFQQGRKVIVSREQVEKFNRSRPCSELRSTRSYWFEFDERGDLVDTDVPEQDDGSAAAAMAADCKAYLESETVPDGVGTMRRIGWKMIAVRDYVRRNPGCPKLHPALYVAPTGPRGGSGRPGVQYGYRTVNRAIDAGLIRAEYSRGRYSLYDCGEERA